MNKPSDLTLAFKEQRKALEKALKEQQEALALALKEHKKALTSAGRLMQNEIKDVFDTAQQDIQPKAVEAQREVAGRVRDVAQWVATQAFAMRDPKYIEGTERKGWELLEASPEVTYVLLDSSSLYMLRHAGQRQGRGYFVPMDDALILYDHDRILKALKDFTYKAVLS